MPGPEDGPIKRKYQVFISSTFDLKEHREQAVLGIVRAGHMPVALENYPPMDQPTREVIEKALGDCQYYVIILGARYGMVPRDQPEGQERSFVEIELEMAIKQKLRILIFVLDEGELRRVRQTADWQQDVEETRNLPRYEALRQRLEGEQGKECSRRFVKPYEIATHLQVFFSQDHDVSGYILEPKDTSEAHILHIYATNEIVRDVVGTLGKYTDVYPRLGVELEKKQAVARAFLQIHGDDMSKYRKVFLDSGSTVTYIAKHLADRLPKRGMPGARPHVLTNNAFAYLYLWLCAGVMCHPVPEGPPDKKYGGMYGPLTDRTLEPNYDLPAIQECDPQAWDLIQELRSETFGAPDDKQGALLLAAISGLQVSDTIRAVDHATSEPYTDPRILAKLQRCRGFHVGSYENMLFKRCYYLTEIPAIVFVDDTKVDCEIRVGKCHFLFDQGAPWGKFASSYPLSLWTACNRLSYEGILKKLTDHFKQGDWAFGIYAEAAEYPIVIGHNAAFRLSCESIGVRLPKLNGLSERPRPRAVRAAAG